MSRETTPNATRRNVRLTPHALATLRRLCAQGTLTATARTARTGPLTLEEAVSGGWVTWQAAARLEAFVAALAAPPASPTGEEASP